MDEVNIGLDNGLSPIRRQTMVQISARLLSMEPLKLHMNQQYGQYGPFHDQGILSLLFRSTHSVAYLTSKRYNHSVGRGCTEREKTPTT